MCPIANAMVKTVSPKAKATPAKPMPTAGKPAAITAEPHPPKTSQNVPKNSAAARLLMGISTSVDSDLQSRLFQPELTEGQSVAARPESVNCNQKQTSDL